MLRPTLRIASALAVAAALLGAPGCGLERLLGSNDSPRTSEPSRRHRHKKPKSPKPPKPPQANAEPPAPAAAPAVPASAEPQRPAAPAPSSVHLALGTPTDADPSDDWLMIKPQFALSYNQKRLGPNWVSWELNASYYGPAPRHRGKFIPDESLPTGWYRVHHGDYGNSDYDRGHMVRSEERTRSREDNESTFLLTNILPQRHDLNAGPWLRLEEYCQRLAQGQQREMFVVAGPIHGANPERLGHGVAVPEAFFKIVVVLDSGQEPAGCNEQTRVIAVIMPNVTGIMSQHWDQYRTSVAEIERRTGYRFLDRMPEATRRTLQARVDEGPPG